MKTNQNGAKVSVQFLITLATLALLTGGFLVVRVFAACPNTVASKNTQKAPCSNSNDDCKALTNPPPTCSFVVCQDANIFCDCGSGICQDEYAYAWHVVCTYNNGQCVGTFCNNDNKPPVSCITNWASIHQTFGCE